MVGALLDCWGAVVGAALAALATNPGCVCVCRAVLGTSSSSRVDGAAPPARLQKMGVQKYSTKKCGYQSRRSSYSTVRRLQNLFLAMALRDGGDDDAAAAAAAEEEAEEVEAAVAGFEQLPLAVQKMYCATVRDADEFREQAGAVIAAYKKAMQAGALQSTAERAAAAVAYKIDPHYRSYMEQEKKWLQEQGAAAATLEKLAVQARRLVKKAQRLVSRGTLPKRLQDAEDAFAPRRAMNIARAILDEVCRARILVQLLEHEARLIPDGFELPYAKKEVESCLCVMDRMQLESERAYEDARNACCPTKSGVRRY